MESFPILVILYAGITHAFEADHVLAVANIVSQRRSVWLAAKDGIFWGLGHTSTILLIGILILLGKANIPEKAFSWFEAGVGLMLVMIAFYRLSRLFNGKIPGVHSHGHIHQGDNKHIHIHLPAGDPQKNLHKASYGIGLVHGLAGSGALVAIAMTQFRSAQAGIGYLFLYGIGSVIGMMAVSGLFSIPFSKKIMHARLLRIILVIVSSVLCLGYGLYVIYNNLWKHE